VEVEEPQTVFRIPELVGGGIGEGVGTARGRRSEAVEVGGEHSPNGLGMRGEVQVEVDEGGGGITHEHLRALEGEGAGAVEGPPEGELVGRHVIAVGPDAQVRVVGELFAGGDEVVEVVGPGRIPGLGEGDALVVGRRVLRGEGELAQKPAVGQGVVEDDPIAVVVGRADPAQGGIDLADPERGRQGGT
jgi:hypothetical protein